MEWLEEGCLVVDDRRFAAQLEERWHLDMERSRQAAGAPADGAPRAEEGGQRAAQGAL